MNDEKEGKKKRRKKRRKRKEKELVHPIGKEQLLLKRKKELKIVQQFHKCKN